jgi:iron complex outermembrane receptor protein
VNTRATINLPIWKDRLLARFAVGTQNSRGYTFNHYRDEYMNDRNSIAFLGSIRAALHDDLMFDLSGTWTRDNNKGRGGQCVVINEDGLGSFVPGFFGTCEQARAFDFGSDVAAISDAESYGLWGTFNYAPGSMWVFDDLTFKSITSWRQQNPRHRADLDMTRFPVLTLAFTGGGKADGSPWFQQQITQEVQANGSAWDERINFVGGVFAMWEKGAAPTTIHAVIPDVGIEALSLSETTIDNWTWALYGQGTVDVFEWMSLTAGLRYTQDKKGAGLVA